MGYWLLGGYGVLRRMFNPVLDTLQVGLKTLQHLLDTGLRPPRQPRDALGEYGGHLFSAAITAGVIRSGVVTPPVRHRLDQHRLLHQVDRGAP